MSLLLLFPNQLINNLSSDITHIYLIDHPIFYNNKTKNRPEAKLNQLRCVYTRATQQIWFEQLEKSKKTQNIQRLKWFRLKSLKEDPFAKIELKGISRIYMFDPIDADLTSEVSKWVHKEAPKADFTILDSPLFSFTREQLQSYINSKKTKEMKKILNHSSFYSWSRKQLQVLMTKNNKVIGGKLSFDKENRQSIPSDKYSDIPKSSSFSHFKQSKYKQAIREACRWVSKECKSHYGGPVRDSEETAERLQWYALSHRQALTLLDSFIKHKLDNFGTFQDAIVKPNEKIKDTQDIFLYHSNLSHCLNNGLLSVSTVINKVQDWYLKNKNKKSALAQTEGFLRQVIGWREYVRLAAWKYRDDLWDANGLRANRKLGSEWYSGETGNKVVDNTIKKAFQTGYLHHIERLMIMGNYMTLSEIKPKEMYRWFMEFAMDSYDWVMILNVFAMASYGDLGVAFTKPYISSANYIVKMSDYKKSDNPNQDSKWMDKWTDLYYRFLKKHRKRFEKNPRMAFMMKGLERHLS